tara:strand:+ start:104 stop:496 length:393 start_codon:yes stop_codon:yes gene_type:complete
MKKLLFAILITVPFIGFGQCVDGDCENGVGTYIWEDGTISNGSWKDGKLNGIVQEIGYDQDGRLTGTFDGEMEMGVMNGWGTETLYDDDGYLLGTYVGEFENNDYNGWGIWIWRDGTIEKGNYKDGELIR